MKLFSWINEEEEESNLTTTDFGLANRPDRQNPVLDNRLEELSQLTVREAMIPRSLIKALDADVQLRRVKRLRSSKSLYFPVYKGDLDHILGWISKNKALELMNDMGDDAHLSQHLRPIGEVNDSAPVSALADLFLKSASPILIAKNAQGATSGIVTLAEFAETLFGFELAPSEPTVTTEGASTLHRNFDL